jgi:hypothetical protein
MAQQVRGRVREVDLVGHVAQLLCLSHDNRRGDAVYVAGFKGRQADFAAVGIGLGDVVVSVDGERSQSATVVTNTIEDSLDGYVLLSRLVFMIFDCMLFGAA